MLVLVEASEALAGLERIGVLMIEQQRIATGRLETFRDGGLALIHFDVSG